MGAPITEYFKKYRDKKRDEGYAFTKILVPKIYLDDVKAYAKSLRDYYEEAKNGQGTEG